MRLRNPIGFMFAAFLASGTAAPADNVRVGYTEFPPYSFSTHDGPPDGLSIDILGDAMARLGHDVTWVRFANPADLVAALGSGEIELTGLLGITESRAGVGTFSDPVGSFSVALVFSDPPPRGALEGRLDGITASASTGSLPAKVLASRPEVTVVNHDTFEARLVALLRGEIDAVAGPAWQIRAIAAEAGVGGRLHPEEYEMASSPSGFLVDPARVDLVGGLNAYIAAANADRRLDAFDRKWLTPARLSTRDWASKNIGLILMACGAVVAALGCAVALQLTVNRIRRREATRTLTMVAAFDLAHAGIVIYDESLRAEMSNDAFDTAFPDLVARVRAGETLPEMLRAANLHGYLGEVFGEEEIEARIRSDLERLDRGDSFEVTMYGADGRVFSRRALKLTGGRVAVTTTDISELEAGRQALAEQAADLRLANERLEAFTRVAAHDLKSPAASVATLLDWLAEDLAAAKTAPPAGTTESIARARHLLRRQAMLIDDLLAYSRAATRGGHPEKAEPTVRIAGVLELVELPKGFVVEIIGTLPEIVVDVAGFDLVIRNLVSNAIKHHDRTEGRIAIRAEPSGRDVVFEVADDGPGVPEAFAERVFEPFFKLRSHDEVRGSGLGLSMIRAAVTAWGGTISLVSGQGARGTIVRFTAPASRPTDDREDRAPTPAPGTGARPACDPAPSAGLLQAG